MGPTMSEFCLIDESDLLNQFCLIGRALIKTHLLIQEMRDHKPAILPQFSQDLIPPIYWQEPLLQESLR